MKKGGGETKLVSAPSTLEGIMAKLKNAPVMLVIMDGWGNGDPAAKDNAVAVGKTPILDGLMKSCPVTELLCSGEAVGLPDAD